jgi:hypothetical protein
MALRESKPAEDDDEETGQAYVYGMALPFHVKAVAHPMSSTMKAPSSTVMMSSPPSLCWYESVSSPLSLLINAQVRNSPPPSLKQTATAPIDDELAPVRQSKRIKRQPVLASFNLRFDCPLETVGTMLRLMPTSEPGGEEAVKGKEGEGEVERAEEGEDVGCGGGGRGGGCGVCTEDLKMCGERRVRVSRER